MHCAYCLPRFSTAYVYVYVYLLLQVLTYTYTCTYHGNWYSTRRGPVLFIRWNPPSTRFLPSDGTLIFKQIELNTKNSTKQQQSCRLVEFLAFNSAFGGQSNQLIRNTLSSVVDCHVEVFVIWWLHHRRSPMKNSLWYEPVRREPGQPYWPGSSRTIIIYYFFRTILVLFLRLRGEPVHAVNLIF